METFSRGILAFGINSANLTRLKEIGNTARLKVYEVTDEVDVIAVPALIVLVNSDKLTTLGNNLLNDYYADAGEDAEELVVWFGSRLFQGRTGKQKVCANVEAALAAVEIALQD